MKRGPYALGIPILWAFNFLANRVYWHLGLHIDDPHLAIPLQLLPLGSLTRLQQHAGDLAIIAAPFLILGVLLTRARLKNVERPTWMAALYLVPWLNVPFTVYMMFAPSVAVDLPQVALDPAIYVEETSAQRDKWESAALSAALAAIFGAILVTLNFAYDGPYGFVLFLGLPFAMGVFSTLFHTRTESRTQSECVQVAALSVLFTGVFLLAVAIEGLICLVMAAPIALILAVIGALITHGFRSRYGPAHNSAISMFLVLVMPMIMGAESAAHLAPPEWIVHTSIEINAPPERVWQYVIEFP